MSTIGVKDPHNSKKQKAKTVYAIQIS